MLKENVTSEKKSQWKQAINIFESQIEKKQINLHGYIFLKGDQIIAERYWKPYDEKSLHRMYSITKSLTSLAIGLLEQEGKLRLDDHIVDYFSEYLPLEDADYWCRELTIRQMLCMTTCHSATTYKKYPGENWVESYFHVKPDKIPGTVFSYDTSSSHTLAALTEKLTGKKMLDYLREKALKEIGFSKEAYILEDKMGVSMGGSGLMCTLRDIAAIAYLCNHYGDYYGKQLLPASFLRRATSFQVPTNLQPVLDEQFGYGYMFWMAREEGFVMYGMGGQLAVCFPSKDFCYITMADTIGNPAGLQMIYDIFYDTIYPLLEDSCGRQDENTCISEFKITDESPLKDMETDRNPGTESSPYQVLDMKEEIFGIYDCEEFCFERNPLGIKSIRFDWKNSEVIFEEEGCKNTQKRFQFRENVWIEQKFPGTGFRCQNKGFFVMNHFLLKVYLTDEEQGHLLMDAAWSGKNLGIRFSSTSEDCLKKYNGFIISGREPEDSGSK